MRDALCKSHKFVSISSTRTRTHTSPHMRAVAICNRLVAIWFNQLLPLWLGGVGRTLPQQGTYLSTASTGPAQGPARRKICSLAKGIGVNSLRCQAVPKERRICKSPNLFQCRLPALSPLMGAFAVCQRIWPRLGSNSRLLFL